MLDIYCDNPDKVESHRNSMLQSVSKALAEIDSALLWRCVWELLNDADPSQFSEQENYTMLRLLALPTLLAEIQRRLEVTELEDSD